MVRCLSLALLLACVSLAPADNWPARRGPKGDGHPSANVRAVIA
jgi:hypothetical protein